MYYYKFKDIRYSMEEGDGVQQYDTPMGISSVTRNFSLDAEKCVDKLPTFVVPPMTQLTLSGELTMEKLTLTYHVVFERCPFGEEHVVTGKYIRYRPCEVRLNKNFEKLEL